MRQIKCQVCFDQPAEMKKFCKNCFGRTWVEIPSHCSHVNAEGEAMTGGWICSDCSESGPGIPSTWRDGRTPPPNTLGVT